jgi:hypothetical protein
VADKRYGQVDELIAGDAVVPGEALDDLEAERKRRREAEEKASDRGLTNARAECLATKPQGAPGRPLRAIQFSLLSIAPDARVHRTLARSRPADDSHRTKIASAMQTGPCVGFLLRSIDAEDRLQPRATGPTIFITRGKATLSYRIDECFLVTRLAYRTLGAMFACQPVTVVR